MCKRSGAQGLGPSAREVVHLPDRLCPREALPFPPVRVLVVDDHTLVREGLAALLNRAGFEVEQAGKAQEAMSLIQKGRPDVAVVDAALPGLSGLELCRRIRRRAPEVRVVMLSMFDEPEWQAEAARAGASAYLLKDAKAETIVETIRAVSQGQTFLSPKDSRLPLTAREREVVRLIAQGKKTGEIAQILCRSVATVRAQKASAMRKLGVHTTSELVREALESGLVRALSLPKRC